MAGIGVKLNKIFQKNTITSDIIGFGYSTVVTIAPMLVVIADILLMRYFLGFFGCALFYQNVIRLYGFIYFYIRTSEMHLRLMRYCQNIFLMLYMTSGR